MFLLDGKWVVGRKLLYSLLKYDIVPLELEETLSLTVYFLFQCFKI